jgi:hypothetical protein
MVPNDLAMAGSCQCGAVAFHVSGVVDGFFLCHCSRCRKDTGSAHGANLFVAGTRIVWNRGGNSVKTYRVPGTRHEKSFCANCGSALPRVGEAGSIVVPAGSLDNSLEMRPTAHICFASRALWDDHLEDVARIDGLPG